MTNSVYVLAPESLLGKSAIALGAIESLTQAGHSVGVFRPIIRTDIYDTTLETLLEAANTSQEYDQGFGVTYAEVREDPSAAITTIIDRFHQIKKAYDRVVILGSDYADAIKPIEFALNARIAANLNSPTILVVSGRGLAPEDLRYAVDFCQRSITSQGVVPFGVVAIGLDEDFLPEYDQALASIDLPLVATVPGVIASQATMPTNFATEVAQAKSSVRTP